MNDTHPSSYLEQDVKVSTMYRLRYYASLTQEEKERLKETYIREFVKGIVSEVNSGCLEHFSFIPTLPIQVYPFHKMIEDIKIKLKEKNIEVTKVIVRTRKNTYIYGCTIYWKQV